jgi:hypothetical protein
MRRTCNADDVAFPIDADKADFLLSSHDSTSMETPADDTPMIPFQQA